MQLQINMEELSKNFVTVERFNVETDKHRKDVETQMQKQLVTLTDVVNHQILTKLNNTLCDLAEKKLLTDSIQKVE
jgi:hypothetical protein